MTCINMLPPIHQQRVYLTIAIHTCTMLLGFLLIRRGKGGVSHTKDREKNSSMKLNGN